jgi:sec-independent protein translocase protein TatB
VPQLSPIEILVVATIALIVFGPEKLPQIARSIGRGASELRRMAADVRDEFQAGLDLDDEEPPKSSRRPHPNERANPSTSPTATDDANATGDDASATGHDADGTGDEASDIGDGPAVTGDEGRDGGPSH